MLYVPQVIPDGLDGVLKLGPLDSACQQIVDGVKPSPDIVYFLPDPLLVGFQEVAEDGNQDENSGPGDGPEGFGTHRNNSATRLALSGVCLAHVLSRAF